MGAADFRPVSYLNLLEVVYWYFFGTVLVWSALDSLRALFLLSLVLVDGSCFLLTPSTHNSNCCVCPEYSGKDQFGLLILETAYLN